MKSSRFQYYTNLASFMNNNSERRFNRKRKSSPNISDMRAVAHCCIVCEFEVGKKEDVIHLFRLSSEVLKCQREVVRNSQIIRFPIFLPSGLLQVRKMIDAETLNF